MAAPDLGSMPAVWGFAGACIYGLPLFTACAFASTATGRPFVRCAVELLTALTVGTLAAAAAVPLALELLGKDGNAWLRALSALVGLMANRVAPKLVDAAPDAIFDWLGRFFRRTEK